MSLLINVNEVTKSSLNLLASKARLRGLGMVSDPVTVRSSTLCAILEAAHLGNSLQIVGLRGSRVRSDGHEETGKTIGASLAAIGGETLEQIIATAMVLFLIF